MSDVPPKDAAVTDPLAEIALPDARLAEARLAASDRYVPTGLVLVSALLGAVIGLLTLAVPVSALLFAAIGKQAHPLIAAELVTAVLIVGLLCTALLDFTQMRLFRGSRAAREEWGRWGRLAVAIALAVIMAMMHPLLGLSAAVPLVLTWAFYRIGLHRQRREPMWIFSRGEAASVLAGRDATGRQLAMSDPGEPAFAPWGVRAIPWIGAAQMLAVATWLDTKGELEHGALVALTLGTLWAGLAAGEVFRTRSARWCTRNCAGRPLGRSFASAVATAGDEDEDETRSGLNIPALDVRIAGGTPFLQQIALRAPQGSVIELQGESGAGKSLFLRALIDPEGIEGCRVEGQAVLNGDDLWLRRLRDGQMPAVLVGETPILLPASGADNLCVFTENDLRQRAFRILERLVTSSAVAEDICAAPDARLLPRGQAQALALARALFMSPQLYLLDRPETGLSDRQVMSLAHQLRQEARLGRIIVMATESRPLKDLADRILILERGRMLEFGDAAEIRAGQLAGWSRFVGARDLGTLENLTLWVHNQFRRPGDEDNRRRVALVAGELLAFSCQSAPVGSHEELRFEFKHGETACQLRMIDDDPASASALLRQAEQTLARAEPGAQLPPLAVVLRESIDVTLMGEGAQRAVSTRIATYDPRKTQKPKAEPELAQG